MKITLTNRTKYLSRDIKKLLRLVAIDYKKRFFNFKFDEVIVKVIYRRKRDGFHGGYAYYGKNYVTIKVSKEYKDYAGVTFEQNMAQTFQHELDHCRGLKHGEMVQHDHLRVTPITREFKIGMQKGYTETSIEIKRSGKAMPLQHIERIGKLLRLWQTKKKRAENAIKKLQLKHRYYMKKHELAIASGSKMAASNNSL